MKYSQLPKSVKEMNEMNIEGNIIPHEWYNHIKFKNGKVDVNSIIILAEIVYWHRPTPVKDELTGNLTGYKKKFKSDLLQRSYDSFADQFGLSKRQVADSIKRLEDNGLIKRVFRNINVMGQSLSNVLFLELNTTRLKEITYPSDNVRVGVSRYKVTPYNTESDTYTESTTKITTESKRIHTITSNGDYVAEYYNESFKNKFGKYHPKVTEEQLHFISNQIEEFSIEHDITNYDWMDGINNHFDNLPKNNDGSILWFLSGGIYASPLIRLLKVKE